MKKMIFDIYAGIVGSLDNKKGNGFSARKLTSIATMIMLILVHSSWLKYAFLKEDFEYLTEVLIIDECFVLLLLGIVTMEQVAALKNNKQEDKPE